MKLKILGSGNALALENYHTNFLFDPEDDTNRKLLIDCGTDIQRSLHNSGHSFNDITDVYISHFHMDHVGGLPALLTHKYFTQREKINLYLPQYRGYEELWTLLSITGFQFIKDGIKGSRHYYERMLGPKSGFSDNIRFGTPFCYANTEFIMIPVPHVKWSWDTEMSYGLFINSNTKIWITTDFVGNYNDFEQRQVYDAADIIIHDCEMGYSSGDKPIKSHVHTHYEDLKCLPDEIKNKIYLTHCPDLWWQNSKIKPKFDGFIDICHPKDEININ